jgi:hypothetical protein
MDQLGVDVRFLLETKLTGGIIPAILADIQSLLWLQRPSGKEGLHSSGGAINFTM